MFTKFAEKNKDVVIRLFDSTSLQFLVYFIYPGEIMVTEKNVQVIDNRFGFNFYRQKNYLLLISQGFFTSGKSLTVKRYKRGML